MIDISKSRASNSTPNEKRTRILIVTSLSSEMGNMAQRMSVKAGGIADVSSSLINALFELGADVHVEMFS